MKTSEQRITHYNLRTSAGLIGLDLEARLADQQANFAAFTRELVPLQIACGAVLDELAAPVTDRVYYQAFSNKIYSLLKTTSGLSAAEAVVRLVALFRARGLSLTILQAIVNGVYPSLLISAYARPDAVVQPITDLPNHNPVDVKGSVHNAGVMACSATLTMKVQSGPGPTWSDVYSHTKHVTGLAVGATPTTVTMTEQWTPLTNGTYRTTLSVVADDQTLPVAPTVIGATFSVSSS